MILVSFIALLAYLVLYLTLLHRIVLKGQFHYVLVYMIFFLSVYTVFISLVHSGIEVKGITLLVQYSKEVLILGAWVLYLLTFRNLLKVKWDLQPLDYLFLAFLFLTTVFLLLPIGPASFLSKAVYTKNILLIMAAYFFGRNVRITQAQWHQIFQGIGWLTLTGSCLIILEALFGTHFHGLIGFADYQLDIHGLEPAGPYNLTWTFVASGGQARYASFFANPLELSASMLLSVAIGFYYFSKSSRRNNQKFYLLVLGAGLVCVLLAYSRASFVAVFICGVFMAYLLRYYGVLIAIATVFFLSILWLVTLAPRDIQYFVLDTISFRESSSITHAIEWFEAIETIQQFPLGLGMSTSGNAGGVESELKVGGENQFLIFGVQFGLIGLLLYVSMYIGSIFTAMKVFLRNRRHQLSVIPFVASAVKVGLFLPLMTANAEIYLYISLVSWWLAGYSLQLEKRIISGRQ